MTWLELEKCATIGISNFKAWQVMKALALHSP